MTLAALSPITASAVERPGSPPGAFLHFGVGQAAFAAGARSPLASQWAHSGPSRSSAICS